MEDMVVVKMRGKSWVRWASIGVVLVTASTAFGQQQVPAVPAPAGNAQTAAVSPGPLPVVTIDECVSAAQSAGPDLKLAKVTLDNSRAQLTQVQGKNGLSLSGTGAYVHAGNLAGSYAPSVLALSQGKTTQPVGENFQGGVTLSGPSTSVGLTAQHSVVEGTQLDQASAVSVSGSQVVYDGYPGGRAEAAVKQAQFAYQAAQVAYDSTMKSVIYQVKQAYYTLLGDQNTLHVREAIVTQAEGNLAYYQGLLSVQRATPLDVLQVQVTLTQARLDLRTAQNTLATDRKNLSLALGWPLDKQYTVADATVPELPTNTSEEALKSAYRDRPELRTLALNLASANVNLAFQKSQLSSVVSVNGSLGSIQDWTLNKNLGTTFTAGLSVALPPLYDGGQSSAQVQQAAGQVAAYLLQQDKELQSITIEVQNALFAVQDARDRLDLAGQNVKQAQGVYDLQKAKFAVGQADTLDVLTAFSTLTTAQTGLEQARSTYNIAVLNLFNAMGQ
jgi:outer membrane protein TolC